MRILRLLGGLSLGTDLDQPVGRAAQKRRLALLAYLASRPGAATTRDKLLALLWPEASSEDARHRLSAALYDLRRALGDDVLLTRGDDVVVAEGSIRCDVIDFEAAIAAEEFGTALALYRGPFLDGVHIEDAPAFDEWVEQRRTQLSRAFARALEEWARVCSERRDFMAAVDVWQRLADSDPLNDRLALGLMNAMEAAGNRAGALRHFALHEARLQTDLRVEPDRALRQYAATLRAVSPEPIAPATAVTQAPRVAEPQPEEPAPVASVPNAGHVPGMRPAGPAAPPGKPGLNRRIAAGLVLFLLLPAALSVLPVQPEARSASVVGTAPTAREAMHQGETFLRTGRFESAAAAFERAVSLDSLLAVAHLQLAIATLWADQPGEMVDSRIANALARRDRLDELNRMLLDGFVLWRRGAWHLAEAVYRRALTTYPASTNARQELAEVLFHYNAPQGRALVEARVEFERVLELEPRHYGALWHLAQIAARDLRVDDVAQLTDRLLALQPDVVRTLEVEVLRAAVLDDENELDRMIDRLRDADESLLFGIGWRLAVSGRDLEAAERVFTLMTDTRRGPNTRGIGQTQLLYIDLARGDRDAVMKRLDDLAGLQIGGAGIELLTLITAISTGSVVPPQLLQAASDSLAATVARETFQTLPLHDRFKKLATLGSIDALLGDSASASAVARRLEKWSTAPDEKRPADSHAAMIRALLARKEHRHEDVIRWTERTFEYRWFGDAIFDPLTAYSITRFIRAEAFLALGRSDEADAWFATIGDHDPSDLAFLGSAIEHRQRIAKARGDLTEAARLGRQLEALRH